MIKSQKSTFRYFATATFIAAGATMLNGCGASSTDAGVTAVEDTSASGAAASSVGGAISSSSSTGTVSFYSPLNKSVARPSQKWAHLFELVPNAFASSMPTACPTLKTAARAGCTEVGSAVDLSYSACNFGGAAATWTGTQQVSLTSGSITCGTFPTVTTASIQRQYVASTSSSTPSSGTRTSSAGTIVNIDHATANLGNYQAATDTIAYTVPSSAPTGYGTSVTWAGGVRTGVTINQRVYVTGKYDHSVTGNLTISDVSGTRTVTGSVTTYHNLVQAKGTSTFNNVTYSDSCCTPTGGSIKTVYASTSATTKAIGLAMNGKSETLTFTACGTGTFVAYDGTSSTVSLTGCY